MPDSCCESRLLLPSPSQSVSQWTYLGNHRGQRRVREIRKGENKVEKGRKGKERRKGRNSSPLLVHSDQQGSYHFVTSFMNSDPLQEVSLLLSWAFVLAEFRVFFSEVRNHHLHLTKSAGRQSGLYWRNSGFFTTEAPPEGGRGEKPLGLWCPHLSSHWDSHHRRHFRQNWVLGKAGNKSALSLLAGGCYGNRIHCRV